MTFKSADAEGLEKCVNVINNVSQNIKNVKDDNKELTVKKERKFWVFVNPVSGTRNAVNVWNQAQVIFEEAGITFDVHITTRAYDCRDLIIASTNIHEYEAIITVSGDGLLLEAVNGVMKRKDWKEVIKNVVLFPLPGGTGNGLSKSLMHSGNTPLTAKHAAIVCAKGYSKRMDIGAFQNEEKGLGYSFLELMWGIPADVDIESEMCRCFGPLRLDLYGLLRICCLRKYPGTFSYLPEEEGVGGGGNYWEGGHKKEEEPTLSLLPPLDSPLPTNWKTIEGNWVMIWAMNVTHASGKDFVAPSAELDDGLFHVVILRDVGRCTLLDMFLKLENGEHISNPSVEVIKTRAFRYIYMRKHSLQLQYTLYSTSPFFSLGFLPLLPSSALNFL